MSANHMLFTLLEAGETMVNKGRKIFAPVEPTFDLGEGEASKGGRQVKREERKIE